MADGVIITVENINELHEEKHKRLQHVEKILHLIVTTLLIISLIPIYITNINVLSNKDDRCYNNVIKGIYIWIS